MNMTPPCPGCERSSLLHLAPGEVERILEGYLRDHPDEPVADDVLVAARLGACGACPDLQFGGTTCRHCGCLVSVRARLAGKDCPAPVSRWRSGVASRFLPAVIACVTFLSPVRSGGGQENGIPQPDDKVQIHVTVTNGFVHPGVGLTREMLETARRNILARKEPWYSGYRILAEAPLAATTVTCRAESHAFRGRPKFDAFDNKRVENLLKQDGAAARKQALMYYFTGQEIFRSNAMKIIRVWSQMDPGRYTMYHEAYIHASYAIQNLVMAAELMRYTTTGDATLAWTEQDTRDFTDNFVVPAVNTFLNENGWFMNQSGYPCAAAMSGDIFRSDRGSYAKRVEWFTVNRTAPNKGWSASIQDLARLVVTNAITGRKVASPFVQLMEMGRDQAHAADDVEILMNMARQMNAQGTKVDPVAGTISTATNAVGPYEFLDDRILEAANQFCRFMLGYDTPWIPAPSDIAPDGTARTIYPRLADNYRGRIRGLDCWDAHYYYTCRKGIDLAVRAPYYDEAFRKRIVASDTDWITIPDHVAGEGARVPPAEQEPDIIPVALRSTVFDHNAIVVNEGPTSFVRVTPTAAGTRMAILSADTGRKTIGLKIRTTGVAVVRMSRFDRPWILPDTHGEWRFITYQVGTLERFCDIVFLSISGSPNAKVDLCELHRDAGRTLKPVEFDDGNADLKVITYVGAPLTLRFPARTVDVRPVVSSLDMPEGAALAGKTGEFSWVPAREGRYAFTVEATAGDVVAIRCVQIVVVNSRETAVRQITSAFKTDELYVKASRQRYHSCLDTIRNLKADEDERVFSEAFMRLQEAVAGLELLTPLLPDGSMDFAKVIVSSSLGERIGLLTDGNDDTFPGYTLVRDLRCCFDFGPGFQFSASAFALEGRLNFEDRAQNTSFFGSNDGKSWTRLTEPLEAFPAELTRVKVIEGLAQQRFRYLKLEKARRQPVGLLEPSEMRMYGQRYEMSDSLP